MNIEEQDEQSRAQFRVAALKEIRRLRRQADQLEAIIANDPKPGPKPKQQVSTPGDNSQAVTHETANDGSNSDTTCPGEGSQPKEGNCPKGGEHEWYYDALSMKTVCKKCWKIKSTQETAALGGILEGKGDR